MEGSQTTEERGISAAHAQVSSTANVPRSDRNCSVRGTMTWQKGLGRGDDGQPGDDDITAWLGDPSEEPGWTCLGAQVRHSVSTLRDGFGRG